jgi:CheY-like chemotaxis protein
MSSTTRSHTPILIASDSTVDAVLVRTLLEDEFGEIALSVNPAKATTDFHEHQPDVLVLAFKKLQDSEDFYLGLYRMGNGQPLHRHRAVILCTKEEARHAYELCCRGLFDDYVLFWPNTQDVNRLPLSVHHALAALKTASADDPHLAATCAAQAARLRDLESLLANQIARGQEHLDSTDRTLAGAERDIGAALDGLSARAMHIDEGATVAADIARCKSELVLPQLQKVGASLQPVAQWAGGVRQAIAPVLQAAHALDELATRNSRDVLIVDDDEFQRKVTARILESEGYRIKVAANGSEAISLLARMGADLVLLDFLMPDMSGLDVLARVKADQRLGSIPVIMITGNSERAVVLDSRRLGAADFLVKPFDRQTLLAKIARVLHRPAHQAAAPS